MSTHYVRLRPRTGKKLGPKFPVRYTFQGARFDAARGWYKIEDDTFARSLSRLRIDDMDPESPRIFNVCTEEEALAIQAAERRSKTRRDVEDADTLQGAVAIEPRAARVRARTGAVTSADAKQGTDRDEAPRATSEEIAARVRAMAAAEPPAMIDPDPEGEDLAGDDVDERLQAIGRIDGGDVEESDAEDIAVVPVPPTPKAKAPPAPPKGKQRSRSTRAADED